MLPRPKANEKEFQRILGERFQNFPKCKENYDVYKSILFSGYKTKCEYFPIKMDYEVSSHCNFRCTMCLISELGANRPTNMLYEDFKKSIDEQVGLIEVKLQGLGEPLLNPNFFKMVEYAVDKNLWVRTTTNASLLHINDNYKKMIDFKIGEIQISVDGATKETFENIRKGSNFEQVVNNCRVLNEYAASKNENWRTSCWMLVQKENFHEVEQLLELAAEMKFTRVTYSITIGDWGRDNWTDINSSKEVKEEFSEELAYRLIERGKELGIEVTFWDGKDKYIYDEKKDKICGWLFSRCYIASDMKIVPCCVVSDSNTCDMGDGCTDFTRVWNGEKYQKYRMMHLKGKIPKMCQNCYEGNV